MKKLLLLLTIAGVGQFTNAQKAKNPKKEFEKISTFTLLGKLEDAKTELEKLTADATIAATPEAVFWKYRIYAGILKDETLAAKYPNALSVADEYFTKYQQIDPTVGMVSATNSINTAFDVYGLFNKYAISAYNTKKYDSAGFYFSKSAEYLDAIVKYKWTDAKIAFDTTSLLYAGASYENAKKPDMAAKYFARLVEGKVGGQDYLGIYRFMLLNAIDHKSSDNFAKYLKFAKEIYPTENWDDYEAEYFNKAYSLKQKAEKYDADDKAGVLTAQQYSAFGESFVNLSKEDKESLDSAQIVAYQKKALDAYKKASDKNPSDGLAAFNVGILSFNEFSALDDQSRENTKKLRDYIAARTPEKDPKKKAAADAKQKEFTDNIKKANIALEKPTFEAVDQSIAYLEKAYNVLKAKQDKSHTEKNCLNKSVDFLSTLFGYKRDKARGKDPKSYDEFDAKYKLYDDLHGKL